ncbi:MAG: hypothetical protein ACOYZ8_04780 [Chloroflexota bacterium]
MRKILTVLFVLAVLALNWAALHDIIKGEPDPRLEWTIVIASLAFLLAVTIWRYLPRKG